MEEPSSASRNEQPAPRARRAHPTARYSLIAATSLVLVALGVLLYRHVANRDNSANRDPDPPSVTTGPTEPRIRGQLRFGSLPGHLRTDKQPFKGTEVGRESDTRKYIAGHPETPQRAIWDFNKLPQDFQSPPGDVVTAKLTCALFPLTKTAPDVATVTIRVVSHRCPQTEPTPAERGDWQWGDPANLQDYLRALEALRAKGINPNTSKPHEDGWKAVNELAEKYGFYEAKLTEIPELTETSAHLPAGLFRNALKNKPAVGADGKPKLPLVSIYIKCENEGMMLGVTEADLYLENPVAKR